MEKRKRSIMATVEIRGVRTGKTCADAGHPASGTHAASARPQPTAGEQSPGRRPRLPTRRVIGRNYTGFSGLDKAGAVSSFILPQQSWTVKQINQDLSDRKG